MKTLILKLEHSQIRTELEK